jgi:hypothetical protein
VADPRKWFLSFADPVQPAGGSSGSTWVNSVRVVPLSETL